MQDLATESSRNHQHSSGYHHHHHRAASVMGTTSLDSYNRCPIHSPHRFRFSNGGSEVIII
jgi:hypothetical protein